MDNGDLLSNQIKSQSENYNPTENDVADNDTLLSSNGAAAAEIMNGKVHRWLSNPPLKYRGYNNRFVGDFYGKADDKNRPEIIDLYRRRHDNNFMPLGGQRTEERINTDNERSAASSVVGIKNETGGKNVVGKDEPNTAEMAAGKNPNRSKRNLNDYYRPEIDKNELAEQSSSSSSTENEDEEAKSMIENVKRRNFILVNVPPPPPWTVSRPASSDVGYYDRVKSEFDGTDYSSSSSTNNYRPEKQTLNCIWTDDKTKDLLFCGNAPPLLAGNEIVKSKAAAAAAAADRWDDDGYGERLSINDDGAADKFATIGHDELPKELRQMDDDQDNLYDYNKDELAKLESKKSAAGRNPVDEMITAAAAHNNNKENSIGDNDCLKNLFISAKLLEENFRSNPSSLKTFLSLLPMMPPDNENMVKTFRQTMPYFCNNEEILRKYEGNSDGR